MKKLYFYIAVLFFVASNLLAQNPYASFNIPSYDPQDMELGEAKPFMLSAHTYGADSVSFIIEVDHGLVYVSEYNFNQNYVWCSFYPENTPGRYMVVLHPFEGKIDYFNFNFKLSDFGNTTPSTSVIIRQLCAYKSGTQYVSYGTGVWFAIRDYVPKYYPYYFHAGKFRIFSLPSAEMNDEKIMHKNVLFPGLYVWKWNNEDNSWWLLGPDDEMRAGVGYCGYPEDPNNSPFFLLRENPEKNLRVLSVRLKRGWNLAGSYYKNFQPNDQTMPVEATSVFSWDSWNEGYAEIWGDSPMCPTSGYWISSNGSAVMFFDGGVPSAPSLGKTGAFTGELPPPPPTLPKSTEVEVGDSVIPTEFTLAQNYPNPFNPTTTISYELPRASEVRLVVFDTMGRVVKNLVSGQQHAGQHQVVWNGRDESGLAVPSGVYFYRINAGGFNATRRMMLVK
ncbi:MAG TPA: FlgD immunoglobulin-like domain containing protein [bacterium]|nr:FlgD immunoglobulin-like domain containing protein [bacterium]